MPDFVPDDIDAYIERVKRVDRVMSSTDNEEVEKCTDQVGDWAIACANALVAAGLEPVEAVAGVSGTIGGVLADWYAHTDYEIDDQDGEARDS